MTVWLQCPLRRLASVIQEAQGQAAAAARLVFSLVRARLARPAAKPAAAKRRAAAPQADVPSSKVGTPQVGTGDFVHF